jgi:predicted ATPase
LLRHPERDEGELDLAGFEQLDVLGRSFGWSHENRDIELAGQQLHEAVPIIVVSAAG